jgi:RNA polymerase sigma-70 factor (ECF subfamily)
VTPQLPRGRDWLEAVFAAYHQQVLAYARRRVPTDDADDVVAEVFASAWQHRDRVPDPPLPWLYRAAANHVLHSHRGHRRRERLSARLTAQPRQPEHDHADGVAARLDDHARVHRALAALSPLDAEVLKLSAWEDLGPEQIAYVLGCTPAAAKVRLHRARRRLAAALATPGPTVHAAAKEATA